MTEHEETTEPPTRDDAQDAPSGAHTELGGEHPAGEGPRSDRDVGGPTPAEGDEADDDVASQQGEEGS